MEATTQDQATTSLAEMLCALSFVADIGMGQRVEHGLRSAYIGLSICREAGLTSADEEAVFYGALLKDAGCTACAGLFAVLFDGNDLGPREDCLVLRPDHFSDAVSWFWRHAPPDATLPARMAKLFGFLAECKGVMNEGITAHCEIGRMYADRLGLPTVVGETVHYSWERWDGKSMGYGLKGAAIPVTARVLHVAQTIEAAHAFGAASGAEAMTRERRGTAFDPDIADALLALETRPGFWGAFASESIHDATMAMRPRADYDPLDAAQVDDVCQVLAEFADAKTRRTWKHSHHVADSAEGIAQRIGLGPSDVKNVWRAGLVHDIGKAAVPVSILEKGDYLSDAERQRFRTHPEYTESVLSRIEPLRALAPIAGAHHEQLDGLGYHRGLADPAIGQAARALAVADRFVLAGGFEGEAGRALAWLEPLAGTVLDADCVRALREAPVARPATSPARSLATASRLTDRETEVLRLVAEGATAKEIADRLVISRKTAEHHLENIYNKLGVTSKTAAAVYAVSNGLV